MAGDRAPSLLELDAGFLALPRRLWASDWFRSLGHVEKIVVLDALMVARHSEGGAFWFAGKRIPLEVGQFIDSEEERARRCGVSRKVIRTTDRKMRAAGLLRRDQVHPAGRCPFVTTVLEYERISLRREDAGPRAEPLPGQCGASSGPTGGQQGAPSEQGNLGKPGEPEALSPAQAREGEPPAPKAEAAARAPAETAPPASPPAAAPAPAASPAPAESGGTLAALRLERERAHPVVAVLLRAASAEGIDLTWPKEPKPFAEATAILGQERALEVLRREHAREPSPYAGWYTPALYRAAQAERRRTPAELPVPPLDAGWLAGLGPDARAAAVQAWPAMVNRVRHAAYPDAVPRLLEEARQELQGRIATEYGVSATGSR